MRQSRTTSLIKAMTNVGVGYGLAVVLQLVLFPALGLHPTLAQSVHFGLAFTVLSVIRSYALRRLFERLRTLGRGGTEAERDAAALQDPIGLHPAIALALGGQQAARIDGALHDRVRLDPGDLPPGRPSFITRVLLVDSRRFRGGQARPGALPSDCSSARGGANWQASSMQLSLGSLCTRKGGTRRQGDRCNRA